MNIKWSFKGNNYVNDENFWKILDFFVIKSPIKNTSARGIPFKQQNVNIKKFLVYIKGKYFLNNKWKMTENIDKTAEELKKYNIYDGIKSLDEIAIHYKSKGNKLNSFFYCIRCAFAHGSFLIYSSNNGEKYYFLENRYGSKISGRIIIKESTLLNIIKYCKDQKKG